MSLRETHGTRTAALSSRTARRTASRPSSSGSAHRYFVVDLAWGHEQDAKVVICLKFDDVPALGRTRGNPSACPLRSHENLPPRSIPKQHGGSHR